MTHMAAATGKRATATDDRQAWLCRVRCRPLIAMRQSYRVAEAALGGERRGFLAALLLIVSLAAATDRALAQTCAGDCNDDGTVQINELILGVNIALDTTAITQCPSLDDGQGAVTVDRLIAAVNNALNGCEPSTTPGEGTATPTSTPPPGTGTPTVTPTSATSVSMWTVDNYDVTSSDCAGVIEDSVKRGLQARGPDFTVRQSGDHVEIEDSDGMVIDGTADPDGTVHAQETISDSIVTCDYDVDIDAVANLAQSPTTATYSGAVNFSGFCLGFSDCSLQITARWRRVEGLASGS